jgi:hypothetical protein
MNGGGNVPKTKAATRAENTAAEGKSKGTAAVKSASESKRKSGKGSGTKDRSKSAETLKTKTVKTQKTGKAKGILPWLKVALVCLLCMFGGAFSIMAFHNDISITDFFQGFYELVMGSASDGFTILEVSYSVGLMAGIVLFYNHIGKRRISKDPTPIEVSMRSYEKEMNEAMVASWEREGKKIDVD